MPDADTLTLRLLIVEDEALVAMLIEDALALHGHTIVGIADTTSEAIALAERERPDMALCDVKLMAGDDGVSVAQALAERGIACLFLSGNCPTRSNHDLILGCLAKPFHTASIGLAVRSAYEVVNGRLPGDLPPGMSLY